jgi:hypothetical protein
MINPLLITVLPVVHCAWLIFESMDTSVLGSSDRLRVDLFADSRPALRIPFLPLNSSPTAPHLIKLLLVALASTLISNPLYNPHRKR